ncbi:MAG: hypothetical protein ABI234_18045 [Ktedonobacteraceae bacterium]
MYTSLSKTQQTVFVLLLPLALLLGSCSTSTGTHTQIDWVDFIQFHGITYLAGMGQQIGRSLEQQDLGPVFAQVQFKLNDNVTDPSYHMKDGDAAFLEAGTKVYTVKGYLPAFRLAAFSSQGLQLFEADTNPHARTGADLLDLKDKVQFITINSEKDGTTVLATVKDAQQVEQLVEMLLSSPVNQQQNAQDGLRYFLAFHLMDQTVVVRVYWPHANELARGILPPPAFQAIIKQAMHI